MEYSRRFYVTSVSSSTVVLSPLTNSDNHPGAGRGLAQVTVSTTESTAEAAFWGTTGTCGNYEVIIRKVS